ncbi:MAG: immunoglobulin-like domain-containing protein, partial [Culicoidibacterales bacterium]
TYTFKLKGEAAIENIDLVQRMSANGPEMYRQTIMGDANVSPEVNTAPVFTGLANKTITVGTAFDALAGVKATDKEDGDVTSQIIVSGTVNNNVEGTYTLTYTVTDSQGLTTTATRVVTVQAQTTEDNLDFNVGQGIQWPSQVNAPFVDMTAWVGDSVYGNSGAANLAKLSQDTDVQFFNLGFIQAASNTIKDGKLDWGFGGYSVLNETNNTNSQYQGIKKSIRELRELGGDVTISLGGLSGTAFWEVTQDVEVLYNTYLELVDGFNLTRLDLDIEGAAQNKAHNIANAKAIKKLQDTTGVDIVLTMPVLPSGLTSVQLDVLEAYLSQGVDVEVVNLMTMCYGTGTMLPSENYGTASLRAVDSTMVQVKDYFQRFAGTTLTTEQAYGKIGTTVSIGFEGSAHPIFTTAWSQLVVD